MGAEEEGRMVRVGLEVLGKGVGLGHSGRVDVTSSLGMFISAKHGG